MLLGSLGRCSFTVKSSTWKMIAIGGWLSTPLTDHAPPSVTAALMGPIMEETKLLKVKVN